MSPRGQAAMVALSGAFAWSACESAPPPKAPPAMAMTESGTPAWLDEVAARCALIASCAHAHDMPRLRDPGACVDWWVARVRSKDDPVHKCLVSAKTCDQVGACVREPGDARAAAYCAAHKGVLSACDGDALVSCAEDDASESTLEDCKAPGWDGACEERKSGGLVVRACYSAKVCPAGAPEERCDGAAAILSCRDGAVDRTRCGPGTRCEEHKEPNGDRGAMCEPIAGHAHCSELSARYCEDGRLVECLVHGHYGNVRVSDCQGLGLRCAGSGAHPGCVVDKPLDCAPGPPRCDGDDALVFCAAGRSVEVSCKGVGLGACDPDAQGPAAACSPKAAKP